MVCHPFYNTNSKNGNRNIENEDRPPLNSMEMRLLFIQGIIDNYQD